jgi:hypothetical protein
MVWIAGAGGTGPGAGFFRSARWQGDSCLFRSLELLFGLGFVFVGHFLFSDVGS